MYGALAVHHGRITRIIYGALALTTGVYESSTGMSPDLLSNNKTKGHGHSFFLFPLDWWIGYECLERIYSLICPISHMKKPREFLVFRSRNMS